jgi:hypothetical protein
MPAPADVTSPFPSIRALQAAVDRTAPTRSRERIRQLNMTVRQLERALDAGALSEDAGRSVAVLLDPENVDDFLDSAWEGRWRDKPGRGELSYASMRTLRDCLNILGQESGVDVLLPRMSQPAPRSTVSPSQQAALYRRLAEWAAVEVPEDGWADAREAVRAQGRVRLLAMVGGAVDAGPRASELSAMHVDDLGEGLGSVRVGRMPQNGPGPAVVEECALREGTAVAVRRWLRVREALVAPLEGAKTALWVSLRMNHEQPVPGLPLMPRGVERAYARGAAQLNVELAGQWDASTDGPWVPLPTRLEQLRRSVVLPEPGA